MRHQSQYVQTGVIGAMQRSNPSWTALFLDWTGIENLRYASFDLVRPDIGYSPATQVTLRAMPGIKQSWAHFCDVIGMDEDSSERDRMPIRLDPRSPYHENLWTYLINREMNDIDGPLEWWWYLAVLRLRGVSRASKALLSRLVDDTMSNGLVSFENATVSDAATSPEKLLTGARYEQPTSMVVSYRSSGTKLSGIRFDLTSDMKFKSKLVNCLLTLATERDSE